MIASTLTVPNVVTASRLLLVIPIMVLLLRDELRGVTLMLLVVFGASDWVDGALARRLGQTSRLGAILDPIADRVGVAVLALGFVLSGHLPLWTVVVVAATDVTLGAVYVAVRPAAGLAVSSLGKVRTAVLMSGLALAGVGLLPSLQSVGPVGTVVFGAGTVLHGVVGAGYLSVLLRPEPGPSRGSPSTTSGRR